MDMNLLNYSSSSQPVVQTFYNSSVKPIPVYKWIIQFVGGSSSELVSYLARVEELCHIEKKDVYESAVDLFSGNSLSWYRSVKHLVNDWDSLVFGLC